MKSPKPKSEKNSIVIQHSSVVEFGDVPPVYLRNGPNPIRHCTDKFCCFMFLLIVGGFGYLLLGAFMHGHHVQNLSAPMDADGNLCGVGRLADYPFIYFVTPNENYLARTVCVKVCPQDVGVDPSLYELQCMPNTLVTSCQYNPSPLDPSQSILIYDTQPLGPSICQPTDPNYESIVNKAIVMGDIETAVSNIQFALPLIAAAGGITFFMALVFTCLLTYITTCITWIFLIVYIVFTGLLASFFLLAFLDQPIPLNNDQELVDSLNFALDPIALTLTVIFGSLFIRALFTVVWRFTKIKFMIAIIKLSTQYVIRNKTVILIPLIFNAFVMGTIGLWLLSSVFILSQQRYHASPDNHTEPYQRLVPNLVILGKLLLNFLGLVWLRQYLLSFSHYLSASTSTLWYMTANENKKSGRSMLWATLKAGIRYHNGSIAAGSIYLFFFEPISNLFNSAYNHLIKYKHRTDNLFLHYFTSCFFCCCCSCERFIMYINKQAYTEVYLLSTDFCSATRASHYTMRRNNSDFQLLSGLGDSFTHFAKMFLFLTTSLGCCWYMVTQDPFREIVWKPLCPALLIGYVSLSTAELFMEMFGQSADSLLLTYFIDLEVEKYHFGHEHSSSCPNEIKEYVHHLRQKQNKNFG